jgi:hypothetical protein
MGSKTIAIANHGFVRLSYWLSTHKVPCFSICYKHPRTNYWGITQVSWETIKLAKDIAECLEKIYGKSPLRLPTGWKLCKPRLWKAWAKEIPEAKVLYSSLPFLEKKELSEFGRRKDTGEKEQLDKLHSRDRNNSSSPFYLRKESSSSQLPMGTGFNSGRLRDIHFNNPETTPSLSRLKQDIEQYRKGRKKKGVVFEH